MDKYKHYPQEWTDKNGNKRISCVCGNELPCKDLGHETLESLNLLPILAVVENRLYYLTIRRERLNSCLEWIVAYVEKEKNGGSFQQYGKTLCEASDKMLVEIRKRILI